MIGMNGSPHDRRRMTEVSNQMSGKGNGIGGRTPSSSKWDINSKIFQNNIIIENLEESQKGESNGTLGQGSKWPESNFNEDNFINQKSKNQKTGSSGGKSHHGTGQSGVIENNSQFQSEQIDKISKKRLANYIRLRTEIFKVTTSTNKINQNQQPKTFESDKVSEGEQKKQGSNTMGPTRIQFGDKIENRKIQDGNKVRTQRYSVLTWAPLSLLLQFKRVSNIYFLIITILTFMSFSPKTPHSMISTFVLVLVFTMIKEGYEDYQRYKQDKDMNNKLTKVLNPSTMQWEIKKWQVLAPGDIVKIECDSEAPADICLLHTSNKSGIVFVDTMNLDGETSLKEKITAHEYLDDRKLSFMQGELVCDPPNENLERWSGQMTYRSNIFKPHPTCIKNTFLRGCFLRNTDLIIGLVVYTGMDTKIMKNLKKPLHKVSNIMRLMNRMLYSVFAFQFALISVFAGLNIKWINDNSSVHKYLDINSSKSEVIIYFTQLLVFWVAYSHMIPISLYVVIEILKLGQASFINRDIEMFDKETFSFSMSRNSDLIEELGQVEMVFSDKTGTLTQNKMIFKKCQINGVKYGELKPNERDNHEGMAIGGVREIRERMRIEHAEDKAKTSENNSVQGSSAMSNIDYPYVTLFFQHLALCNTVTCDYEATSRRNEGEIVYKAASPDELALVQGAKSAGIQLASREHNRITIYNSATKETLIFKQVAEFPFDSVRKRMSVVIKDLQTGQYKILCKGADSVMLDRIKFEKNGIDELRQIVDEDLYQYSCEGLRTLLVAQRNISKEEFDQFISNYQTIQKQIGPEKEQKLFALFDKMEQKLRFIGCSAIEDKLQEGVSVTIAKLMTAEIRFFMLTGDKLETAIEIARSCQIIQDNMHVLILGKHLREEVYKRMFKHAKKREIDINYKVQSLKDVELFNQVIAVEGSTLALIIEDQELQDLFFHIAIRSKSVVCCRMSPKQKADVVNIFKTRGSWITLAIGDGANDVSMIMEAHIGVGIKGKEGTQAMRSADFAIGQFQFLMRLLLFHGRNGYSRVSSMICYYFYKNIVLVLTEYYFAFFNGFSGQIFFLDWLPMLYNAVFTSWHCLFSFHLEKDVNFNYSFRYPQIYKSGQLRMFFNYTIFWKWIILGLWHGAVCFYLPIINNLYSKQPNGARTEHWVPSTISFSMIVHLVIYKLWLESRHFNSISFLVGSFCILIYWCFLFLGQIPVFSNLAQPQLLGVTSEMFESSEFWLMIIGGPLVCLAPDLYILLTKQVFYPSPIEKVLFEQKFVEPNYDYREHFNKLQKSLQMRKRQAAIQNEQRKIILAHRRSTFCKQDMQLNGESSLVSIKAEDQLLKNIENSDRNKLSQRNDASGAVKVKAKQGLLDPFNISKKNVLEVQSSSAITANTFVKDQLKMSQVKKSAKVQPKGVLKNSTVAQDQSIQSKTKQINPQNQTDHMAKNFPPDDLNLEASMRSDRQLLSKAEQSPPVAPAILNIYQPVNNFIKKQTKPHIDPDHQEKPTKQQNQQLVRETSKIIKPPKIQDETLKQGVIKGEEPKKTAQSNEVTDFYKKLPFNTYKEGSVNDISSASSFSGNRSPRQQNKQKKAEAQQSYKQDVIESPRGSIKESAQINNEDSKRAKVKTQKLDKTPKDPFNGISEISSINVTKLESSIQTQNQNSVTNKNKSPTKIEKPNNIQEDSSTDNTNMTQVQQQYKQVDLEAFKKIMGNRTPNYFMMQGSTQANIPIQKKRMNYSPSAIEDNFNPHQNHSKQNLKPQKVSNKRHMLTNDKEEQTSEQLTRIRTPTFDNNNNLRSNRSIVTISSNVKGRGQAIENGQKLNNESSTNEIPRSTGGLGSTKKERKSKK